MDLKEYDIKFFSYENEYEKIERDYYYFKTLKFNDQPKELIDYIKDIELGDDNLNIYFQKIDGSNKIDKWIEITIDDEIADMMLIEIEKKRDELIKSWGR